MIYLLIALAILAVLIVAIYNGLVKLKNQAEEAWSNIDTQLKKRYDLIPNLVETVKGYAAHEKETLENVTKARTAAMEATGMKEKAEAENMLSGALKSIFALAESYPDLKANQNFLDLQKNLTEIENSIQTSRSTYNEAVRALNTKIEVFPNTLIAGPLGFKKREFFEISEKERENVKVSFAKEEPTKPAEAEAPIAPPPTPETEEKKKEDPEVKAGAPDGDMDDDAGDDD